MKLNIRIGQDGITLALAGDSEGWDEAAVLGHLRLASGLLASLSLAPDLATLRRALAGVAREYPGVRVAWIEHMGTDPGPA